MLMKTLQAKATDLSHRLLRASCDGHTLQGGEVGANCSLPDRHTKKEREPRFAKSL